LLLVADDDVSDGRETKRQRVVGKTPVAKKGKIRKSISKYPCNVYLPSMTVGHRIQRKYQSPDSESGNEHNEQKKKGKLRDKT
jgi:hypothetical protein